MSKNEDHLIFRTDFSYNWNNKLECQYFTTLRLHNEKKYQKDSVHSIYLKNKFLFDASVEDVRVVSGKYLNAFVCGLDTGYSVEATKGILSRMYKKTLEEVETQNFSFVLFRAIKGGM